MSKADTEAALEAAEALLEDVDVARSAEATALVRQIIDALDA